ncbi:MAG: DUF2442 domain-containing protein [Hespellia sp.]|nr:DUF2442 domain-containing protein [Hespellia sp.]
MKKYPKLEEVSTEKDYRLHLKYNNGEERIYDFSPNFEHPFYMPLKDERLFSNLKVENGGLYWATGQDFCPHTLYDLSEPILEV